MFTHEPHWPAMLHRLRIAVSVFFALVAVAFVALWVRSYWRVDEVFLPTGARGVEFFRLAQGYLETQLLIGPPQSLPGASWESYAVSDYGEKVLSGRSRVGGSGFTIPLWLLVILSIAIACCPWIAWSKRFTLRTMLIATTLIAVVLGLAVWAGS